ncbi:MULTISPECIES: MFS transporter [unclassified Nodularia (in: cyanobacteria)]|uniref:MFS transporter n=1 Tax=unclassified Nodularia (in: cyanobacteria) TaxID=2656917 RepID=UPI001880ABA0|nr:MULTISPECIES: MFS transporter [unclassified Nodularia (in: cyanobacteria)]MBE9199189.1 MFS transporter [Nodularia sp. LEGE 06071]MCC2695665.1 MFS transporter [Nodularia sp. LEGE 04288]
MFQGVEPILRGVWLSMEIAPGNGTSEIFIPEQVSLVFSGNKFIVALLAGTLMALAFQFLLTNFSLAVGILSLGNDGAGSESSTWSGTIRRVETKISFWALITISMALFIACFLAVKLSLIESMLLGAIMGVVIWSTYFTLIVWLGSSTLGSLVGSFINTTNAGLQAILGTVTATIGSNAAKKQAVATAEEITDAVRRELTSGLDAEGFQNTLQSSLKSLQIPEINLGDVRQKFAQILSDVDLASLGDGDLLENINRETFIDLISSQGNLSKQQINQIADQLEEVWKQVIARQNPTEQVINLLKSATPEELKSENLGERLQELVGVRENGNGRNSLIKQGMQYGLGAAGTAVLNRVDFSDIDIEKITTQVQKLREKIQDIDVEEITHQLENIRDKTTAQIAARLPQQPENTIKADVEDYILNSLPWHFNRITIRDEFQEVIYDPQADPTTTRRELSQINQEDLRNWLQQRGDISEGRVTEITQQMESIREEVLEIVQQAEVREKGEELRLGIENYLRSTSKAELNAEAIERDFSSLLADFTDLEIGLQAFDRDACLRLLSHRQDVSETEADQIVSQLESICERVLNQERERQAQATETANQLWQRIEEYLRNTNKDELNPEGIKREFGALLEQPEVGINLIRTRLSHFNRDTVVKLLSQRQDLSESEVNRIFDQIQAVGDRILQAPQATVDQLAEYLRNTNLEELNPEGIRGDLETLLADPREGALAFRHRLSQIDRETLVKLLSQSQDLSEEQVNRRIDQVQEAINSIIKAPRRYASRAAQRVTDFETHLENYLRHTDKEELNPESIKRDLQLLLRDPQVGVGNLGDRLAKFDRSTIVALLSQREDISEEEANRIVDQIESVRDSIVGQLQQVQERLQSVIDGVFGKIRDYLNSLERPELNYESIQQDFAKLFDDPQAGFEALRDRLSQFDSDTLVAILSSREDITPEDANRIINQIEAARDGVLQRGERIQQEVQKRLEAIQEQAKQQAEETKRIVANAAWWLFGTAVTSLCASAIAGALATQLRYMIYIPPM